MLVVAWESQEVYSSIYLCQRPTLRKLGILKFLSVFSYVSIRRS